jgi:hypothetical protein
MISLLKAVQEKCHCLFGESCESQYAELLIVNVGDTYSYQWVNSTDKTANKIDAK